jgi:phage-related protein
MEQEEIRLLKARALLDRSDQQRIAFLFSFDKDYEALVKDKEDPSEESTEEC